MTKRRLCSVFAAMLAFCSVARGHAQGIIHVPADQPTIQGAINAGGDGTTVLVAPGTYYENLDFEGKQITLTSSGGAATTILDGSKGGTFAISITPGTAQHGFANYPTIVNGFTIQNSGVEPSTAPTGGIYTYSVAPKITNNVITNNHCAGIFINFSFAIVQNNEIDNTLDNGGDCFRGGGSAILVTSLQGGSVNPPSVTSTLIGNTIQNNLQGGQEPGGGASGITVLALSTLIQGNTFSSNRGGSLGGALYLATGNVEVIGNLFDYNTSACGGAALATARPMLDGTTLLIANNTIVGSALQGVCTSTVKGGGYSIAFGDEGSHQFPTVVVNNLVSGSTYQLNMVSCGLTSDDPTAGYNTPIFDHNLFYNGGARLFDSTCANPIGLYGNLNAVPQFTGATAAPFALSSTSPAIDAGNTSEIENELLNVAEQIDTTVDLAGNPRVQDATGKGYAIVDIGAYEYTGVQDQQATSITLKPSTSPTATNFVYDAAGGDLVNLSASLTCASGGSMGPLGTVTFLEDGSAVGTAAVATYTAQATLKNFLLVPGIHHFTASYAGQGTCDPGVSVQILYFVSNYNPSLTLTSSVNPSLPAQSVTFTIALTGPGFQQPSSVVLTDNGTALATLTPDASGSAAYTTSTFSTGTHNIVATYAGDTTHNATSAGLEQIVSVAGSTYIDASSDTEPSAYTQPVTVYITVAAYAGNIPKGTVMLSDGSTPLATLTLDPTGSTIYTTATLAVGSHTINVVYTPTTGSGFVSSNTSFVQDVLSSYSTSIRLQSPASPSIVGQSLTFTARLSSIYGTPTGAVQFFDNGTLLTTIPLNANAAAIFTTSALAAGQHTITANYVPDTFFAAASIAVAQQVNMIGTTAILKVSPASASYGVPLMLAVTVTPLTASTNGALPGGLVTFYADGLVSGAAPLSLAGLSSISISGLSAGPHTLTCTYAGDANYNASTCNNVSFTVTPGATSITIIGAPSPAYQGQVVTFSATVAATASSLPPVGTVTLYDGGSAIASAATTVSGSSRNLASVTFTTSALSVGSHSLTATFTPGANFLGSTSSVLSLTILPGNFTFTADAPSLTIRTEYHGTLGLHLNSTGFTGPISLACAQPLPPVATCELPPPVYLATNGTTSATLTLDTDALLNFHGTHAPPPRPGSQTGLLTLAALLPLTLFGLRRRKDRARLFFVLSLLYALTSTLCLTGCSGKYPDHTPPGTYDVVLTATGTSAGTTQSISQTLHLTLIVTP